MTLSKTSLMKATYIGHTCNLSILKAKIKSEKRDKIYLKINYT